MLDDYIKELIENNNRVIIPNFGAFLLRATSKNKNKKDLAAKVQDIYFSPFLKFNDELLVNHIMKKEDVDQKGAMEKINDYIKQIESTVKKDGSYKISGLGEFTQDAQGKIQFTVAPDTSKPAASEQKKEEKKPEEKKPEEKKAEEKKEEPKKEPPSKPKTVQEKAAASRKKEPSRKEPAAKAESESKQKTSAQQTPPPKKEPVVTSTSKKKGTNKGLVLSIAIGVPVAIVFIWAMLNFDTVERILQKKNKEDKPLVEKVDKKENEQKTEQDKQQKPTDAEKNKKPETQQTKAQETQQQPKQTTTSPAKRDKKFYIVAGSFKKKQNAVNFRQSLVEKGYDSELIGERNGMHAVSYASFQSKNKAEAELQRLRKEGIQAWLLYY